MKTCYMEQLPIELKEQIMGYLPGIDLARLACVSREWRRLTPSSNSEVWRNLCHADKAWKMNNKVFRNHPKYDNLGWSWKDLFGLWTLCGSRYYISVIGHFDCAEKGLHSAIKWFKIVSAFPPIELQPNHDIHSPGFIDQDPELPNFDFTAQEWMYNFALDHPSYHFNIYNFSLDHPSYHFNIPPAQEWMYNFSLDHPSYHFNPPPYALSSHQAGPLYQPNADPKTAGVD